MILAWSSRECVLSGISKYTDIHVAFFGSLADIGLLRGVRPDARRLRTTSKGDYYWYVHAHRYWGLKKFGTVETLKNVYLHTKWIRLRIHSREFLAT
jgi:hypothetical protein